MKYLRILPLLFLVFLQPLMAQDFSMEAITSYPFPGELTASSSGTRIAFTVNEQGKRNIYVAEGPDFKPRKLTNYDQDEGQEITSLSISSDGRWVVFVRGGDHGGSGGSTPRNPASSPVAPTVQLYSIPFDGGKVISLGEGDNPQLSPVSTMIAFLRNGQIWRVPADGSERAKQFFYARGRNGSHRWSPDGKRMLFVSSRGAHSFIGVYSDSLTPIQWIAPSFARDQAPEWAPDSRRIVFIRKPAVGGKPDSLTSQQPDPWDIYVADLNQPKEKLIWSSPRTLRGQTPSVHGRYNLHWVKGDRIVFTSYKDGWPHLYAIPASGGQLLQLTRGNFMLEHIRLSPDQQYFVASANTGPDKDDIDRRHIVKIPVDRPAMSILTPGKGIESFPVITGDGQTFLFFSADAKRPAVLAKMNAQAKTFTLPGEVLIPSTFPSQQLVEPTAVQFRAPDGMLVYGQLFSPKQGVGKKPAIVFVHGGPQRQMLLGWHYGDYYSNTYAMNQYLASKGFVVLSVNYRLGIGYGFEFHRPKNTYIYGASEYQDIKAAGEWLAARPEVDASRIGIYGGSYGGFLTAMALGKDSELFAAGVDIHGVHNHTDRYPDVSGEAAPDADLAKQLIWESSPIAWLDKWTSPVLFIHGDDDANVNVNETTDIIRRFEQRGMPFESLMIPDETHHWMKYSNQVKVNNATADFLLKHLQPAK